MRLLAIVGLACMAMSAAHATPVELRPWLGDATAVDLIVSIGDKGLCTIKHSDAPCRFDLPPGTSRVTVRGTYTIVDDGGAQRAHRGETTYAVLDFAGAGKHLGAAAAPYGQRLADYIAAVQQFAHKHLPDESIERIAAAKPVPTAAIAAAEKRLGFALPAEFVALLRSEGKLTIGDHSTIAIDEIDNAYAQMRKVWGTPEDAMQEDYSENFRAFLKSSVLLFTEVGDGYGGLLYKPGPTKTCGAAGSYTWTSQEGGTDLLKNPDGTCMDFTAAFRWVLDGFVLDDIAEAVSESDTPRVLVDTSHATQALTLSIDTRNAAFGVGLRGHWNGPYQ